MVLTLYKLDASPPVRAVYMVIHKLKMKIPDVNYVEVNVLNKEQMEEGYCKMNPQHTIPTLVDDDFIIWDSHAISAYLVNKYAENDPLYPSNPVQRALIDQRLHFDSGVLFTALRSTLKHLLTSETKSIPKGYIDKINQCYHLTEKFLTADWLAGNHLTIADICCIASISSMDTMVPIDAKIYPKVISWLTRCSEMDFYKTCNEPGLDIFRQIQKNQYNLT